MSSETPVNPELLIKQLRVEQETSKQIIYEYKRKIYSLEILEKEYQEDIERSNQDKKEIVNKLELKIEQLEEENCHLRNNYNEEVQILQKELTELQIENKRLKNEIDLNRNEFFAIYEESPKEDIEDLKSTIRNSENLIENLNLQLSLCQKQCSDLKETEQILKRENESLQENVNLKREDLHQANELIQDLQDNIMCLKSELDSMKNKPLDEQSRGNSLFAEVNDSRVQLMKKLKIMMTKYNEMAKDRDKLLREIECLRRDKTRMIQLFETDIEQYRSGDEIEDAHKSTIDGFMKLIDNYKKEVENLKRCDNSTVPKDLKYYETCLNSKEKEIQSLRDTLESHSTSHILKARNIALLNREMVNWKWKASEFENQIQMLNNKLKEFEQGYNKELDKYSIIMAKDLDEHTENENFDSNSSKGNNQKMQKSNLLNEKYFSENIKDEKCTSRTTNEPEEQKHTENKEKYSEVRESVIDLTSDDEKTESKKTVHFSEDAKKESENITLKKAVVVVNTHLPVTSYRKAK